jgi:hypothetical protein
MNCEICDTAIPEMRLKALPETTMCIKCAAHRVRRLKPEDVLDAMAASNERDADEILRGKI